MPRVESLSICIYTPQLTDAVVLQETDPEWTNYMGMIQDCRWWYEHYGTTTSVLKRTIMEIEAMIKELQVRLKFRELLLVEKATQYFQAKLADKLNSRTPTPAI